MNWTNFGVIIELLELYQDRLCKLGVIDNTHCVGLYLKLHGDGSGQVVASWCDALPGERGDRPRSGRPCRTRTSRCFTSTRSTSCTANW